MEETRGAAEGDRIAGAVLIIAGVGIPFGMMHHPTHLGSGAIGPIHAALILLLLASAYGFTHQALRLGMARPAVLAGLVAYAAAAVANLFAAIVNGFAAPRLAARGIGHDELHLFFELNTALAEFAALAAGAALLLWGLAWWTRPGLLERVVSLSGIAAGAVPAALLLAGTIEMDVHGALFAYGAQALWGALVGWALLRRRSSAQATRGGG